MTNDRSSASLPTADAARTAGESAAGPAGESAVRPRPDRMTIAAGAALLCICALHTAFFAVHPWWGEWLAGPFRAAEPPADAIVQFWALPGGLVVPGALLALLVIDAGRRGRAVPVYVGVTLGVWALACVWMVGPSGFLLVLAPAVLIVVAGVRSRRRVA